MGNTIENEVIAVEPSANLSVNISQNSIEAMRQQIGLLKDFVKSQLREGINNDFAVIPGTPKKTLLKPGAEKLANLFKLGSRIIAMEKEIDRPNNYAMFTYTVEIFHMPTGRAVTQCQGSCNSLEKKYRERTIWEGGRPHKEETPIADIMNTLMRMAQKRAYVGAVIIATGASDFFSSELEDLPQRQTGPSGPSDISERKPEKREASPDAPVCCGKPMMISKYEDKELGGFPFYCLKCKNKVKR